MKSLSFVDTEIRNGAARSKAVRAARFEARSCLPVSAACVVANGVRETLSSILGAPVAMRLFEPSIPSPQAWPVILENARLYRMRGSVADAAIVLRRIDAGTLAAALFGEPHSGAPRELSPLESDVIDRMIVTIAANLSVVCGKRDGAVVERVGAIAGFVTYFELSIEQPVSAGIGVALSRDPIPERGASLDVANLAAIHLRARAMLDLGTVEAAALARIAVGTTLPLTDSAFDHGVIAVDRRRIAGGGCGVRNGQYAIAVDAA